VKKFKLKHESKKRTVIADSSDDLLVAITNNLSGAVIVTDADLRIFHYNAGTLDLLNVNIDLKDRLISDILILTDDKNKPFDIGALLKRTNTPMTLDDMRMSTEPDELIRLEVVISPIRSKFARGLRSRVSGYVLFLRDITKAKSLEEERNEFIGVVSHELRTPTTVVEGAISNLQLMLKRSGEVDKQAFGVALEKAHQQTRSLSELINNLSTLSRSEREVGEHTELMMVDLRELMNQLAGEFAPVARKKGLGLKLEMDLVKPLINTYCPYLEEIIRNFLTNAVKYTEKGEIVMRATDTVENVTIAVKDTGIGISRTDQKRIFDKFYRSENFQTRKTEGIGLGLYITFKLVKKLGGELTLNSQLGGGSTFALILPRD